MDSQHRWLSQNFFSEKFNTDLGYFFLLQWNEGGGCAAFVDATTLRIALLRHHCLLDTDCWTSPAWGGPAGPAFFPEKIFSKSSHQIRLVSASDSIPFDPDYAGRPLRGLQDSHLVHDCLDTRTSILGLRFSSAVCFAGEACNVLTAVT
ncbi:hypothetical protein BDZ89DRAFT_150113 [Hymenopellis radicata]|nr:hypothetical protein BDZ89DRAFT_150113 [Hymenopellis radicata]